MSTALLLGPNGLVGSHLLHLLLEAPDYERVTALSRRPLDVTHPRLTVVISGLAEVGLHKYALQADHIYCCLGTTIRAAKTQDAFKAVDYEGPLAVARLQEDRYRKTFLLVSSLGADWRSRVFYTRVKGEAEQDLGILGFHRVVAARPSLLLGKRLNLRPGELLGELGSLPFVPLMRGAWRKYRPIQAATVADNLLRLARGQDARDGMEWGLI
jgi:uncharacterized protein YbjT (DUF2867 family)